MSIDWIPADPNVIDLEQAVEPVFSVHDVEVRAAGKVIVFRGQFLRSPEMVFDEVTHAFRARGFVPHLRQEDGHDILVAYPAQLSSSTGRVWVNVVLFVLTVLSTLLAGTWMARGVEIGAALSGADGTIAALLALGRAFTANWTAGLPFATALLGILGVHELGHYFVARYYGLDVSLPYFIPFPLNPYTGTLGAVIRIQSPFESRKALFDVGVAGPLAGLVIALPVVAAGLLTAEVATIPPGDAAVIFNEPLLFQWMADVLIPNRPPNTEIMMNPLLMAGWWGFLITALNLLPVSQLDGGHVAYAVFGRYHRYVAWGVFLVAAALALLVTQGYILMLGLVFLMGIEHPPALNDLTPIGRGRTALGLFTLLLFLMLVHPNPIAFQ